MKILGIDPGMKTTGYGFIETIPSGVSLVEVGTINPKQKDLIQNRINKVYTILNELLSKHNPDVLILEKLYAHHKHPMTASILGHVRGAVCLLCAQRKIELVEYSVKRIRKALLGNGSATKIQTRRAVSNYFKVNEEKLTLDASDALALALGYAQIESRNI
ncbi:MAG: crossover junction endodeoxyribonuclease RuvC [Candidatus Zapsychrus exili]|nr:crossover junction endodeoxyribonuclease RuvC [Candidatus Zapsychrus exili]